MTQLLLLLALTPSLAFAAPDWKDLKSQAIHSKDALLKSYPGQGKARSAFAKAVDALWKRFDEIELTTRDMSPQTRNWVLVYNFAITWPELARHLMGPGLLLAAASRGQLSQGPLIGAGIAPPFPKKAQVASLGAPVPE